jgi:hypothetical protein
MNRYYWRVSLCMVVNGLMVQDTADFSAVAGGWALNVAMIGSWDNRC